MRPLVSLVVRAARGDERGLAATAASIARACGSTANEVLVVTAEESLRAAFERSSGEWIALFASGDLLLSDWIDAVANCRDADVLYGDSLLVDPATGRGDRFFFRPDWSPELILGFPFADRAVAIRRDVAAQAGGIRDGFPGAEAYDLVLRVTEETAAIRHVDRVLWGESAYARDGAAERAAVVAALARRGTPADVELVEPRESPAFRIRRDVSRDLASIIIPTRDRVDLLRVCVESIERHTRQPHELVIVDNDSKDPETLRYLDSVTATVVRVPGEFNFSALNNLAVAKARGRFVVFLNNDTEVHGPQWLTGMLEYAALPEVGAVGAKLLFPDGTLQHAGLVVHAGARVDHLGHGRREQQISHPYFLRAVCEVSVVTAACLAMRKDVFLRVGGFDPRLRVAYNDVDLCLRLRRRGYRVLFNPFAVLTHHECASRPPSAPLHDEALFRARWLESGFEHDGHLGPVAKTIGRRVAFPHGVFSRLELHDPGIEGRSRPRETAP